MQVRFSKGMRKASVGVAVEVSVSNRTSGINTRSLRSGMQALLWFSLGLQMLGSECIGVQGSSKLRNFTLYYVDFWGLVTLIDYG